MKWVLILEQIVTLCILEYVWVCRDRSYAKLLPWVAVQSELKLEKRGDG